MRFRKLYGQHAWRVAFWLVVAAAAAASAVHALLAG
jgi:hypothetical protein